MSARFAAEGYWHKGYACGYGTFSIVGMMGEQYGAPYSQFPSPCLKPIRQAFRLGHHLRRVDMVRRPPSPCFWGHGTATPWSVNFFRWCETTKLPIYDPGDAAQGVKGPIPFINASDSRPLPHFVSKCYEQMEESSKERSERCGRITADVTKKAIKSSMPKSKRARTGRGRSQTAIRCLLRRMPRFGQQADIQKGKMD